MDKNDFYDIICELEETDGQSYEGYYCGYNVLKMKDLSGASPELFLVDGNRTAGKTFFFKRFMVRFALETRGLFMLECRKRTQIASAAQAFIEDISHCPDFKALSVEKSDELVGVKVITYDKQPIGYVTYLNYADDIKESSNLFNSVNIIMKDEFQVRRDGYVAEELRKFRSIHRSVARGYGEMVRYVPTILVANHISIINPYYVALGIHKRLQADTRKMRGEGWVLEITFNENASRSGKESSFERAFGEDIYSASDNDNKYLDNLNLVGKEDTSKMRNVALFVADGKTYGVWQGTHFYISTKYDPNTPRKYSLDRDSHNYDTVALSYGDIVFTALRKYFERGQMHFESIECKSAVIDMFARACLK